MYNTNQVFYVFKCIFSTWRLPFQIVGSQYVLTTLRIDGTNIHAFGTGERPIWLFLSGEKISPLEVGKVQDKAGSDTQYDFEEKDL